jgi:hypothetical protein
MFILELTLRSWYHAEENKRRTLQRNDIAAAIMRTDIFDFLVGNATRMSWKWAGSGKLCDGMVPQHAMPGSLRAGVPGQSDCVTGTVLRCTFPCLSLFACHPLCLPPVAAAGGHRPS